MNIIYFGLGRSSFRSPLHPRVLALLLFSLSLSPGTFSPTLGLEARARQGTARQASRGDQQSGSVASGSALELRIRPSLSAFSSSRSYHGSSSSLHGPPRLHVLAESLVNAPDSEVLRLKEKQQLRREALREWAWRHDLDPKDFDLTKKTPEEAIADSVEHDGKVAVRELGIRKGFGIRNWLLLQLGMLAIFLLLLYLVQRGADTHDARQSFNAIASADSEEAGQAGRRGHGASGHARMLDYLSIDTDGGLDRIHTEFFHKSHWGRFIRVCVVVGGGLMNVIVLSLVSIFMMDAFCRYLGGIPIMELDELSRWSSMDLQMRRQFLPFAALIAFIELVVIMGDGAIAFHWDCGVSSMFYIFHANIEQNVNLPQFGGMNKVKYMVTADGYDTDMESEKYGKLHIVEKYTDDGVTIVTTYKGKTHTEFAKRVINENGFYRLASQEGWYEMMKADGMPMDLVKSLYGNVKFHWTNCGDSYKVTECLGNGTKDSYSAKFDQEIERPNPCLAGASTKVVMSKLGTGKYKVIMKDTTKGTVYDITDQFYDGYIISCGKNLSTGMTFKCKFEKFVCFEGKYKTISMENAKEILDALGLPADMKQKALNDYGTLEFIDKCPVYHWKWDSAISPLDITFKMDEEVEYFDKFINEHTKVVSSQSGNKLMTTAKNSYGTWVTTSTFTDSFCIMKCALVGLDLPPMVFILEKIC